MYARGKMTGWGFYGNSLGAVGKCFAERHLRRSIAMAAMIGDSC